MDRQIVYPSAIPLETDLLNIILGALFQDNLGSAFTGPVFTGFSCVPNTPAALGVVVNPGAVYAFSQAGETVYSSLAADSTAMVKQGILSSA